MGRGGLEIGDVIRREEKMVRNVGCRKRRKMKEKYGFKNDSESELCEIGMKFHMLGLEEDE